MTTVRTRLLVHAGLLTVAVVAAGLGVGGVTGVIRVVTTFLAAMFLPGAAVLSRLPSLDLAAWCGLAVTISLALETVLSLVMVWTHLWHPSGLMVVLGASSMLVLLIDLRRTRLSAPAASAR